MRHPRLPQRRSRSERTNEYLAQFRRGSRLESAAESARDRMGSGDRQTDARAGIDPELEEAQRGLRSRTGDRLRTGTIHLSDQSERAVGGIDVGRWRKSRNSLSANILERRAVNAERNNVRPPLSKSCVETRPAASLPAANGL